MKNCPVCDVPTEHKHLTKEIEDGIKITYSAFVCYQCGREIGTIETASTIQKKLKKGRKLREMLG